MPIEKHDLHHEFPEFSGEIRELKMTDNHFAKLFSNYHDCDREINRIEQGVETPSDEYLNQLKVQRLNLKDELYQYLKNQSALTS
ncbi:MAG: GTP-binding protein [Gammaproteobacteria bacterium]|nr:MAG: GTP-binding protein [Gammaproteobacteria bacterium]